MSPNHTQPPHIPHRGTLRVFPTVLLLLLLTQQLPSPLHPFAHAFQNKHTTTTNIPQTPPHRHQPQSLQNHQIKSTTKINYPSTNNNKQKNNPQQFIKSATNTGAAHPQDTTIHLFQQTIIATSNDQNTFHTFHIGSDSRSGGSSEVTASPSISTDVGGSVGGSSGSSSSSSEVTASPSISTDVGGNVGGSSSSGMEVSRSSISFSISFSAASSSSFDVVDIAKRPEVLNSMVLTSFVVDETDLLVFSSSRFSSTLFALVRADQDRFGVDLSYLSDEEAAAGNVLTLMSCVVDSAVVASAMSAGAAMLYPISVCQDDQQGPPCTDPRVPCKVSFVGSCNCNPLWNGFPDTTPSSPAAAERHAGATLASRGTWAQVWSDGSSAVKGRQARAWSAREYAIGVQFVFRLGFAQNYHPQSVESMVQMYNVLHQATQDVLRDPSLQEEFRFNSSDALYGTVLSALPTQVPVTDNPVVTPARGRDPKRFAFLALIALIIPIVVIVVCVVVMLRRRRKEAHQHEIEEAYRVGGRSDQAADADAIELVAADDEQHFTGFADQGEVASLIQRSGGGSPGLVSATIEVMDEDRAPADSSAAARLGNSLHRPAGNGYVDCDGIRAPGRDVEAASDGHPPSSAASRGPRHSRGSSNRRGQREEGAAEA